MDGLRRHQLRILPVGCRSFGNLFPDEVADLLDNNVDPDDDCGAPVTGTLNPSCMANDTADLDDDFDGVYDHWDVDDDNNGVWDFFEIDVNDDLDDDLTRAAGELLHRIQLR